MKYQRIITEIKNYAEACQYDGEHLLDIDILGILQKHLDTPHAAKVEEPLALECMRICTMWIDPMAVPNDVEATIAKARAYLEGLDDVKGGKV